MLFDEHRPFLTKPNDLNAIITKLKEYAPERAIMVEVTSEADAFGAAEAMAYVVQHEKFTPNILARVVLSRKTVDGRPVIAAAGAINAQNAGDYAKAGVDTLVTSALFYAKPVDIQVRISSL
jgi:molybdenum transport protein